MDSFVATITEHPFLQGMKPEHRKLLADCAMQTHFSQGQLIFREGDLANRFYLIEEGKVALETQTGSKRAALIQTVGAGEVLGWSWLFPPYYWHFNARAMEPTSAIFFYGTHLRDRCDEDHDFGYELMKCMTAVIIQRLQSTRSRLLAFHQHAEEIGES